MVDMTITEAASVLSGVVNNLKAARILEEALIVVRNLDNSAKEANDKKVELDEQAKVLRDELTVLEQEIESAKHNKETQAEEIRVSLKDLQHSLSSLKESAARKSADLDTEASEQGKSLDEAFRVKEASLNGLIADRNAELKAVEKKLSEAESDLSSLMSKISS